MSEVRRERIDVRVTREEKEMIKVRALKARMTMSEYIIAYYKNRIGTQERKIERLNKRKTKAALKAAKAQMNIGKLEVMHNYLKGLELSNPIVNMAAVKTEAKIQRKAAALSSFSLDNYDAKIAYRRAIVDKCAKKLAKAEEKVKTHTDKIDYIKNFMEVGLPNQVISFFLAERAKINIEELNRAIENPESFFKVKPMEIAAIEAPPKDETPIKDNNTDKAALPLGQNVTEEQLELYALFNSISVEEKEKEYSYAVVSGVDLPKIKNAGIQFTAKPHEGKYVVKVDKADEDAIKAIIAKPAAKTSDKQKIKDNKNIVK